MVYFVVVNVAVVFVVLASCGLWLCFLLFKSLLCIYTEYTPYR